MMVVHNCEQGSADWYRVRMGIPTASEFSTVMASGKDGGASKTRKTYMYKLAGEIITGEPMETFSNAAMDRGKAMEAEARQLYSLTHDVDVEQVGFISNGRKGGSPDGLVGSKGAVEIKTKAPHLLIEALLRDDAPPEHRWQTQGNLWIAEREWIDLAIHYTGMPQVVHRAYRNEPFIAEISAAVDQFNEELDALVERVRRYGQPEKAAA